MVSYFKVNAVATSTIDITLPVCPESAAVIAVI